MDPPVQCPVCTLFLHSGMSLESHLDTHPKDQVIKALCSSLSVRSNYGSRATTPARSERSYRSRSRTPAVEDSNAQWNSSHRGSADQFWRRTPSRTPVSNVSRTVTPSCEARVGDINFDNSVHSSHYSGSQYSMKIDKTQQTYPQNVSVSDIPQYVYYPEQPEIKYSRSAEYNAAAKQQLFTQVPVMTPGFKIQTSMLPAVPQKNTDLVKLLPKNNNLVVKTSVGGVQYIAPAVKQLPVMIPSTASTFTVPTSLSSSQETDENHIAAGDNNNKFNHPSFAPGTTVVTQNSQIIYREMIQNIDGKPYIPNTNPVNNNLVSGHENVTNMAQATSMYQNVMVVDQFGNASCMYATHPQHLPPKNSNSNYGDGAAFIEKNTNESNKTLIIEVGPIVPPVTIASDNNIATVTLKRDALLKTQDKLKIAEKTDSKNDTQSTCKGLKILSNIKVEVPVQHHKNLLNKLVDLTGPNGPEYHDAKRPATPDQILPDLDQNRNLSSDSIKQPPISSNDSVVSHTFSVIKNIGNPPSYRDSISKPVSEVEFSDSCPIPDLMCNEKPSISPCSDLENADHPTDQLHVLPSPKTENDEPSKAEITEKDNMHSPVKSYKNNALSLNNIFVKKHKKVLQIKNSKSTCSVKFDKIEEPGPSSSKCAEHYFALETPPEIEKPISKDNSSTLTTISIERIMDHNEFDADTEEQSMDLEPVQPSSFHQEHPFDRSTESVRVKEEVLTSNDGGFSNHNSSDHILTPLESIRPINVITYGNMPASDFEDESNHRELLELEAASKNKQFVSMMNENYFGDSIYSDYFNSERVEAFDAEREPPVFTKELPKEGMYMWGEPSQKESEFVLPNFIHESYKIAESNGIDYTEIGERMRSEVERCEIDSKADVMSESRSEGEPPINICADERMPPRGELSGQESNGDMEPPWPGMYQEVGAVPEPYDLIARESWVSDCSDVDPGEKRDTLEEELHLGKAKQHTCGVCGVRVTSLKELRTHKQAVHAAPTCSRVKTTYSRLVTQRVIKKEERTEDGPTGTMLVDSKESITTTMLQVYDAIAESKPKLETLIKQEPKRKRKDYVCPTCKVDQLTDAAFHAHLKIHPLECLTCGKCFFRRANLSMHIKMHLGIKNYKCEVCEKRFMTRQKLAEHHNVHTGRAPVKCTHCDETFRRYSNMVQHRNRHHFQKKAKIRDYVCHCGGVFHSRAKLRWHQELHDEKPKACLYCSDKFVHAASLTRHVRRSHNEYYVSEKSKRDENVPCPVCKQVYLRSNLRAHLQTHSGKRPYLCVVCNKAFTTKWNLKLHRWTHMSRSSKPYKCALCKGAFIRQSEYVAHMNSHRSVRPYTCNYCGCQFIRKYNCQRHVREHEMTKKYVCKVPECGKSFHRSYYLSEHMKVHSGARPFACNICGKTSSNKSNHNKHVKIHHAREPVATEA